MRSVAKDLRDMVSKQRTSQLYDTETDENTNVDVIRDKSNEYTTKNFQTEYNKNNSIKN